MSILVVKPSPGSALLVAHYFPPINVIAAQRTLRIARVLLKRYDTVYVLRLGPEGLNPSVLDFDYGRDVLDHPRLTVLDGRPLLDKRGYSASPSIIHRVVGAVLTRLFCDPGVDWLPAVSRCLSRLPEAANISMVVASGPPFIPLAAVVRWAYRRSIPVVLDYRDLWTKNPVASYPNVARFLVNRLFERRMNRTVSLLTTVSQGCRDMLLRDTPDALIQVLLNVPDATYREYFGLVAKKYCEQASPGKRQHFRIVFTGQVYATCTFAPLLKAMLSLPTDIRERFEVHYYGRCSAMVSREFQQYDLGSYLSDFGMVSKEDSIKAVLGADLLLSLVHTENKSSSPSVSGMMTTKVYDYLLSGNPILSIGPADAEINSFAKSIGYSFFHSFAANETLAMAGFLNQVVTDVTSSGQDLATLAMPDFSSDFEHILDLAEQRTAPRMC